MTDDLVRVRLDPGLSPATPESVADSVRQVMKLMRENGSLGSRGELHITKANAALVTPDLQKELDAACVKVVVW